MLEELEDDERAKVLKGLLEGHPELRDEAERLASRHLEGITSASIAEDVASTLESISLEDMSARSGRQPGLGYVHPNEAAWDLFDEAVEPFVIDMHRRARLGLTVAASEVALGILAGLYQCREAENGTVLAWLPADEATFEYAQRVAREAAEAGLDLVPGPLEAACPEWVPLA